MSSFTHDQRVHVVVGVDTHRDFHVAFAKTALGEELGERQVPTNTVGFGQLLAWAKSLGEVDAFGIEGASCYGAGLTRFLVEANEKVFEVGRPSRQHRARYGKSDPADARAAAGAVIAGDALGLPKPGEGEIEMIRVLSAARSSAVKAKKAAGGVMRALVVTAPEELKPSLTQLSTHRLVRLFALKEPPESASGAADAVVTALCGLARRYEQLEAEAASLLAQIRRLVEKVCPDLLELPGVGPEIAATMLVANGGFGRIGSERALAKLCGVSPIDASSGLQVRHRLNRGGNRQANRALHTLVVVRLRIHAPTRAYMERRLAEGKTKKEVMRCLKRYVVREIFGVLSRTAEGTSGSVAAA
jgi:transposase